LAVFYREGETKIRPGIYQRHVNIGATALPSALDGICALPVHALWGPLHQVVKITEPKQLTKIFGDAAYSPATHTVPLVEEMFRGGANTVYLYRLGSGGTPSSLILNDAADPPAPAVTLTAKYPGDRAFSASLRTKAGDDTTKELVIYDADAVCDTCSFPAGGDEAQSLIDTLNASSESFSAAKVKDYAGTGALATVSDVAFTPGTAPSVTHASYSEAWAALEPYPYNTIALDVDDDASMSLSLLLQAYLDNAYQSGKLAMFVTGEPVSVPFETRCAHAKAFNDPKVVFLGGGWNTLAGPLDGVHAICHTAGIIAATPANQGITHATISGATDVLENLTYRQYEQAIQHGMLMVSRATDGNVWFDSGVNSRTAGSDDTLDDGWKKIRRVKVRFEIIDRLDRQLAPKVGRVSCDSDGVADIVQSAQRILDAMANEGKLFPGASFAEDPANPFAGDSAWFIIQADDIDSLEKIYLQYQFRYAQNA